MPISPFDALASDWLVRAPRRHGSAVLEALCAAEPALAAISAGSLPALISYLSDPPPRAPVPHWLVTAALIRQLEVDDLVGVGLLVALRPGLLTVGKRLEWGAGGPWASRHAFVAELLSTAWSVLASVAGTTVAFPERTVLRRVRQRLAAERASVRRQHWRERPVAELEPAPSLGSGGAGWRASSGWQGVAARRAGASGEPGSDLRLASLPTLDALGAVLVEVPPSVLHPTDVAIVYAHRVLGYSLREIAARSHQATTTVRLRCRRAEAVLCAP